MADAVTSQEPLELIFNLGDRVRTAKYGDGVVRYFGPHKAGKDGTYVGIELDNPEGRMNGTIKENTYFATKPQHGALLLSRKVELIDRGVSFSVGDLVNCGDLGMGTVEYFGPHAQKAWFLRVGVALLEQKGVHDGSQDDHEYFKCAPGHGILVKPDKLELLKSGFAQSSKWHQKVFLKERAKIAAAEEAERKKQEEEEIKLQMKKQKEKLTSRYKPPSTGFADSDAAVKAEAAKALRKASGADAASSTPKIAPEIVRHSDKQDEFDPQAQFDVSAAHVGTLRRKVGSRTYLFEQVSDEHADRVKAKSYGSLSGMYVEISTWTFWNERSAETYLAKWTEVLDDDRAAEAYTGLFKKPANPDDSEEVAYLVINVGTCQQFVNLYGEGNAYHLMEEAKGEKFKDPALAKQMAKANGMKTMHSRVFTVKSHAKMEEIVAQWSATSTDYKCTIVEYPGVSLVGGWRTVASFCKNPTWVAVIGEFDFANDTLKDKFVKEADKLSGEPVAKAKGVEKETLRGQIEPIVINYASVEHSCVKIAFYDGDIWGRQKAQNLDKVARADMTVIGPGTATHAVASKIAAIDANPNASCLALTHRQ